MNAERILQPETISSVDFSFVKYAKLKAHTVIIQKRIIGVKKTQENKVSLTNLEKGATGQYNGYMSPATRRKVRNIIENYLTAIQLNTSMVFPKSFPSTEVYPTFLTLTLPSKQLHCDNDLKQIFADYMQYLTGDRAKGYSGWGVKNYIWTAETQKNGNLHFHVILDRALPAKRIQEEWNRHLERLGYITRFRNCQNYIFRDGFYVRKEMLDSAMSKFKEFCKKSGKSPNYPQARKDEIKRQKEAFERGVKSGWNNPPTTKIHAIQNIKKLTAYVSKYMTKEPEVIAPQMKPGQKLIQENGKYFIETVGIEERTTFEGINYTVENVDRQPVEVKFNVRHIRGRIWGASKPLHTDNLNPYTINLEHFNRVSTTTFIPRQIKYEVPVYTTNIWGQQEFVRMNKKVKTVFEQENKSEIQELEKDIAGNRWIEWLETEHVPKADIERATAKAGDNFRQFGGKIIPLEYPQKDLLKAYSPKMFERYCGHYSELFKFLYPVAN